VKVILLEVSLLVVLLVSVVSADPSGIVLRGRESIWMSKRDVTLSDLMEIEVGSETDSEAVIALGKMKFMESPKPGASIEIAGTHLLELLKGSGVNLEKVRYVIPRRIKLNRSSQSIQETEVTKLIEKYLLQHEPDSNLQRVVMPAISEVFTGKVKYILRTPEDHGAGRLRFPVEIESQDGEKIRVTIDGYVTRFKEVPVARHPVKRGDVLGDNDIVKARISLTQIPDDLVLEPTDLSGMEVSRSIGEGQFFQTRFLKIAPVVQTGAVVSIQYTKGLLQATASGTALDDGPQGAIVRVRNDASRKILKGRVVSESVVEVGQ
jgi:flagella basal body P-ring formation protein FlgA